MNPALATSLLKSENSIENNALEPPAGVSEELSNELFAGEFSSAMEDISAADGKFKPLDVATLKQLGIQQLTELEESGGVQLPSQLLSKVIELQEKQASLSNSIILQAGDSIEEINLTGNPDAITLLKANVIDNDFSENDLFINQTEKSAALSKRVITDVMQQLPLKKESGLSQISSDIDFSQYVKELITKDTDISKELLIQTNRQEINTTKLVDQLASIDKPINVLNPVASPSLKTYSNLDPSTMLNRIEVPVTQAGWAEAVGNRLMMMVNGKMQSANIHLNPAELGPIEIRININQEQASVHFVSNNSLVREAIEDAFPRLKEMFMQNGLSLSDANVSQQSSQQGNPSSTEQNNTATLFNKESLETADVQIESANQNVVDIGLIDHYV